MSSSQRRRLALDQASIRNSPPPDYFFPPSTSSSDSLTGLTIALVGPSSTPFESGLFHITLRIPTTYPTEPPKASFKTKIFHPNVDERTGDVCVDTLKRDWKSTLTLKDVLVTIRCLLVFPNPTSSLNEAAGKLLLEDYDGFARHARLMTSVHAAIPEELKEVVEETRRRCEDDGSKKETTNRGGKETPISAKPSTSSSPTKKILKPTAAAPPPTSRSTKPPPPLPPVVASTSTTSTTTTTTTTTTAAATTDPDSDSGKENEDSLRTRQSGSPSLGKRTISEANDAAVDEGGRKSPKLKEGTDGNSQKIPTSPPNPLPHPSSSTPNLNPNPNSTNSSSTTTTTTAAATPQSGAQSHKKLVAKKGVKTVVKKIGLKRF